MRREVAERFLAAAREIAIRFSSDDVDSVGYDRDDYVSDLVLKAYQAWQTHGFRRGFGSSSESNYVLKSMWNRARDLSRQKRPGFAPLLVEPLDDGDTEARLEARDQIRVLDRRLTGWERDLLAASGAGGTLLNPSRSRTWNRRQLSAARQKARKILGTNALVNVGMDRRRNGN